MRYKFMQVCTRPTAVVVSIILSIPRFHPVFPAEVSVKILYAMFATFRSIMVFFFLSTSLPIAFPVEKISSRARYDITTAACR